MPKQVPDAPPPNIKPRDDCRSTKRQVERNREAVQEEIMFKEVDMIQEELRARLPKYAKNIG